MMNFSNLCTCTFSLSTRASKVLRHMSCEVDSTINNDFMQYRTMTESCVMFTDRKSVV